MTLFDLVYPYLILTVGVLTALLLSVVGLLIGFDMLKKDPVYDASKIVPAVLWMSISLLLAGAAIGLTKWALTF